MKCANCGTEFEDGILFCPVCGKEVQWVPEYNTLETIIQQREIQEKETGEKFSDFLLRVRLEESRRLLGATRKSIQEIAGMAGFPDAAYFSRAFKERYGKSPMEYRKGI